MKRSSLETATDQIQWQIGKPCSKDHNGEMRKRVDPTDTSLFSHSNTSFLSPLFSNWMFKAEYVYGKMIADEDCKVVKFSPFLHEQCNRVTIKTPYLESGGGKWKNAIRIYLYLHNKFSVQAFICPFLSTVQEGWCLHTLGHVAVFFSLSIPRLESGR